MTTIDNLEIALATYDAVVADCPANKQRLGERPCPKCKALSNEGCRAEAIAAFAFIREVRGIVRLSSTPTALSSGEAG